MQKKIQLSKFYQVIKNYDQTSFRHIVHLVFSLIISLTSMLLYNRQMTPASASIPAFLFTFFLVLAFSRNRWIFAFAFPVLVVPSALLKYFVDANNISINENIAAALMNTNYSETMELVSAELVWTLVLALLYCGAATTLLFYLHRRYRPVSNPFLDLFYLGTGVALLFFVANKQDFFHKLSWMTVLFAGFSVAHFKGASWPTKTAITHDVCKFVFYTMLSFVGISYSMQISSARPFDLNKEIVAYYLEYLSLEKESEKKTDLAQLKSSFDDNRGKDLKVVLIIGESARADHFSLNGYQRGTNPLLSKREGLVSFTKVHTRSASTGIAVPNIITRSATSRLKGVKNETSIISIFNKHDFFTGWVSSNEPFGKHDSSTTRFAKEAQYLNFRANAEVSYKDSNDKRLLPIFNRVIKDHTEDRLFLVLHTRGSHWRYDQRYPKKFEKFSPVTQTSNNAKRWKHNELINAYDNSILFTDYIIDSIIEKLEDSNAVVLYVGDHGESLGEDGFFSHSNNDRSEQKNVPMVLWGSKAFRSRYQKEFDAFSKHQHKKMRHDIVFHTLLGLTGFKSDAIDDDLNLSR
ncbi:MAG: lipid A phosphoethanolamine transferase [Deltaproteobacteria bacterium]|nr:lipid A phosphoethanolamine transferase [Deltaproteobacteria bacterium]